MKKIIAVVVFFVGLSKSLAQTNLFSEEEVRLVFQQQTNNIVNESRATKVAEMLTKTAPETAWDGVGMDSVRTPDKREKLDIFSFRQNSWPTGFEVQYRDEYPLSSVGQTTQARSLFVVWKKAF